MKKEIRFKAYVIFLNTNGYINRDEIKVWLAENSKFSILDNQLINVCFFDIKESLVFLLKFYDYTQIQSIKEIIYSPPIFGHIDSIRKNYPDAEITNK